MWVPASSLYTARIHSAGTAGSSRRSGLCVVTSIWRVLLASIKLSRITWIAPGWRRASGSSMMTAKAGFPSPGSSNSSKRISAEFTSPAEAPDRFSSNGNLETQNYFSLDGVDNNSGSTNLQEGSTQTVQPPPDALQEFRVQTRTYSAEFGTSAGAVINASIKSGSNGFHGDVWEFVRNNKFDSNTFFNNAGGVPRGHFSQNQFGGTISGPIVKNKTFFFFDAQTLTSRKATTTTSTVPTPLMKQGNFTELKPTVTDPKVAGQSGCVVGNIISKSCIDPTGQKLLALFPDPNIPGFVAK
jgi:hypothetical protein